MTTSASLWDQRRTTATLGANEGARSAAGEATAESRDRDAYARAWTHVILPMAQRGDQTRMDEVIRHRCTEFGIPHQVELMLRNYREMFPELAAADEVMAAVGTGAMPSQEDFVAAVAVRAGLGGEEEAARVERYWRAWSAAESTRAEHLAAPPGTRPLRDHDHDAEILARLARLRRG